MLCCLKIIDMLTQNMISALADTADSIAAQNPLEVLKDLKELLETVL